MFSAERERGRERESASLVAGVKVPDCGACDSYTPREAGRVHSQCRLTPDASSK